MSVIQSDLASGIMGVQRSETDRAVAEYPANSSVGDKLVFSSLAENEPVSEPSV